VGVLPQLKVIEQAVIDALYGLKAHVLVRRLEQELSEEERLLSYQGRFGDAIRREAVGLLPPPYAGSEPG
jgi:hypothetical protein